MNAIFFMGGSSSAVQQVGASKSSPDHLYFYNDICVTMMKGGVPDCPPEPLVRPEGGRWQPGYEKTPELSLRGFLFVRRSGAISLDDQPLIISLW